MSTVHPLVVQLRFTRSEFKRAVEGVSDDDGRQRFLPMNSISWNVGHLAWQEQYYWLYLAQGFNRFPEIEKLYGIGAPASTPALSEMLATWEQITEAADPWLDQINNDTLQQFYTGADGQPGHRRFGDMLLRMLYHYWYHLGENIAVRQLLGHGRLPQFIGNIDEQAPYRPEALRQ